jgi:Family of unknown function (DUF5681)
MTEKPREPVDPTDTSHPLYDPARDSTHPFYEGDKTEAEQKPDPSKEDAYKVGPGFPPNEHKWKKGCPSPYPKGRPKKVPSMEPEIKKIFVGAMNVTVHVTKADKKVILTRLAMGFEQLAIQWAKGDRHARRDVFTYAAMLGVDLQPKAVIAEALGIDNQAIVDAFLRRQVAGTRATGHPRNGLQRLCRICIRSASPGHAVQAELAHRRDDAQGLSGCLRRGEAAHHQRAATPSEVDRRLGGVASLGRWRSERRDLPGWSAPRVHVEHRE